MLCALFVESSFLWGLWRGPRDAHKSANIDKGVHGIKSLRTTDLDYINILSAKVFFLTVLWSFFEGRGIVLMAQKFCKLYMS